MAKTIILTPWNYQKTLNRPIEEIVADAYEIIYEEKKSLGKSLNGEPAYQVTMFKNYGFESMYVTRDMLMIFLYVASKQKTKVTPVR